MWIIVYYYCCCCLARLLSLSIVYSIRASLLYKLITHMAEESLRPNDDGFLFHSFRVRVDSIVSFCFLQTLAIGEWARLPIVLMDITTMSVAARPATAAELGPNICVINVYDGTSHSFISFAFYLRNFATTPYIDHFVYFYYYYLIGNLGPIMCAGENTWSKNVNERWATNNDDDGGGGGSGGDEWVSRWHSDGAGNIFLSTNWRGKHRK